MERIEGDWLQEIAAFAPQSADLIALAIEVPGLAEWRAALCEDPDAKEDLAFWEGVIHSDKLAVPIEQSCLDGELLENRTLEERLRGCPQHVRDALHEFLLQCPEDVQQYLRWYFHSLVQVARTRRTGNAEWLHVAPSGSPEVLRELMFKWGPKFKRHRSSW